LPCVGRRRQLRWRECSRLRSLGFRCQSSSGAASHRAGSVAGAHRVSRRCWTSWTALWSPHRQGLGRGRPSPKFWFDRGQGAWDSSQPSSAVSPRRLWHSSCTLGRPECSARAQCSPERAHVVALRAGCCTDEKSIEVGQIHRKVVAIGLGYSNLATEDQVLFQAVEQATSCGRGLLQ